jgi:hypothetical protein
VSIPPRKRDHIGGFLLLLTMLVIVSLGQTPWVLLSVMLAGLMAGWVMPYFKKPAGHSPARR